MPIKFKRGFGVGASHLRLSQQPEGMMRVNIMWQAIACLLLCMAIAGCLMQNSPQTPSIFLEPNELHVKDVFQEVKLDVVFSNSIMNRLALASDDIHRDGNLIITTRQQVDSCTSWDSLMTSMPNWAAAPAQKFVVLQPGEVYRHRIILGPRPFGLASVCASPTNTEEYVCALFSGWGKTGFSFTEIRGFPKRLRPYVWTSVVTSMPIRVSIGEHHE